jgi:hypothetical protein
MRFWWIWEREEREKRDLRIDLSASVASAVFLTDDDFSNVPNGFFYLPRFCDHRVLKPYY